jgi:N-carbamoyl-L-amino-acid hydrolase
MNITVDSERLTRELDTLAAISEAPAPAVTRVVYSEADLRARAYVKQLAAEAGLALREDAVGNLFARWRGAEPELAAIGTGSHIDAIPNAGRYDGTVGVLGGLEAIRALQRAGVKPRRSIELLIFAAEEPTRFGIGCFGSRLLAGTLGPEAGTTLRDKEGRSLDEWRAAAGFAGDIASARLPANYYAAFVELHIEQGPLLEREGVPIGIVTAIAAPASLRLWIEGEGGHAGGVLMPGRRDALCAAAEIVLAVETAARETGAIDTVATCGVCDVFPGAINSIPSRVRLELDVRDIDEARRNGVIDRIAAAQTEIAASRNVSVKTEIINIDAPTACDLQVIESLARGAEAHSLTYKKMISRAYHDSLFMARIAPTAMLFIPCRDGVSHRPDEYASPGAIATGVLALAEGLRKLAG